MSINLQAYSTRYSNNILRMASYFEPYIMHFIEINYNSCIPWLLFVMYSMAKTCLYMYKTKYKWSLSPALLHFRKNWLIFLGFWGEAELSLGIWGAKANTLKETRTLFAGRLRDQCIIFRDHGSTDPPWGPHRYRWGKKKHYVLSGYIWYTTLHA